MEEISAFLWRESLHDAANSAQQTANGALSCLAQMRLQFAEGHLDGIEVRRVGRQINQCCPRRFDRLSDAGHLVDRQIVHHDNLAALEGRNKILFHISKEQRSIHGAFKDERRGHSALAQGADKGDDFPVPVRRVIDEPLAARTAAAKPYHRGVGPRLVDKHQPCRVKHALLAHPASALADHIGTLLLGSIQSFFLKVMPWRSKKRHTAVRLPSIPTRDIATTISSSVMSGCAAISPSRKCTCSSSGETLPPLGFASMLPVSLQRCIQITTTLGLIP